MGRHPPAHFLWYGLQVVGDGQFSNSNNNSTILHAYNTLSWYQIQNHANPNSTFLHRHASPYLVGL